MILSFLFLFQFLFHLFYFRIALFFNNNHKTRNNFWKTKLIISISFLWFQKQHKLLLSFSFSFLFSFFFRFFINFPVFPPLKVGTFFNNNLRMKNNFRKKKKHYYQFWWWFQENRKNDFRIIIFLLKFLKNLPSSLVTDLDTLNSFFSFFNSRIYSLIIRSYYSRHVFSFAASNSIFLNYNKYTPYYIGTYYLVPFFFIFLAGWVS